ncbi:uracil phosphoribosyltransferase [Candidatus Woesearchaeota archaeon]|nr:uracil phosphoribosyltransferase [Candidatus Woesearchaeota archaeon]
MLYKIINSRTTELVDKLRDTRTKSFAFSTIVDELAAILAYEAGKDLPMLTKEVPHWQGTYEAKYVDQSRIGIFPVLRAGIGMEKGVRSHFPNASVYHLGMRRDETTAEPIWYREPENVTCELAILPDPMLATGGSGVEAMKLIESYGCKRMKMLSIVAAPEGIARIEKEFPQADIYVTALDERLNEQFFILPGLGDAGDRIYNTQ